jgi:hypothetical protein
VIVNDAAGGDRFMPALTVLKDGSVGVAFYDRRRGRGRLDVYAARVAWSHGPHVSTNVRLNTGPSYTHYIYYLAPTSTCFSPGRFFGDYIAVASAGGGMCVVWADTQLQAQNETDIWYRAVTLPPASRTAPRVRTERTTS